MAYTSGCETERIVPSTHDPAGVGDLEGGRGHDRVDCEAGGPYGDRGRDRRTVGGGDAVGVDAGHGRALVHGDAELADDRPEVPAALGREPVAEAATDGEGDVEVRARVGDLGRGLQPGQSTADDGHCLPGIQLGQALTQPKSAGAAGEFVRVLCGAGDALGVPAAAECVDEGVVLKLLGAVDGDDLAIHVDPGDRRELQYDAGAREHLTERPGLEVLAGRQLVHADPLHEIGFGVDEGDGDLLAVQPLGEPPGGDRSGVAGSEDDDAVLHIRTPVCCGFAP
ncbi:hypothetical protein OG876_12095 [Kribbella sp. NBC_00359]